MRGKEKKTLCVPASLREIEEKKTRAETLRRGEQRRRKLAVKVVDIFGNDTMTIVEVTI